MKRIVILILAVSVMSCQNPFSPDYKIGKLATRRDIAEKVMKAVDDYASEQSYYNMSDRTAAIIVNMLLNAGIDPENDYSDYSDYSGAKNYVHVMGFVKDYGRTDLVDAYYFITRVDYKSWSESYSIKKTFDDSITEFTEHQIQVLEDVEQLLWNSEVYDDVYYMVGYGTFAPSTGNVNVRYEDLITPNYSLAEVFIGNKLNGRDTETGTWNDGDYEDGDY